VLDQLNKATQPITSGGSGSSGGSSTSPGTSSGTSLPAVPDVTTVVPDVGTSAPALPDPGKVATDTGDVVKGATDALGTALGGG